MAATPPRRLLAPTPSLYDGMVAEALSAAARRDVERTEREHPDLIVEREGNVLLAHRFGPTARLAYSFRSERDFTQHFPAMFDALLKRLRRAPELQSVRFRLMHGPARPVVEPVLRSLWFKDAGARLEFSVDRGAIVASPAPRGVRFRPATVDDAAVLARIDLECFPNNPLPATGFEELLSNDFTAELALARGEAVGFCTTTHLDDGVGHIGTLAVSASARGRGLGAALTARAVRRLARDGGRVVMLGTDESNATAIRLYLRLGFRQTRSSRDYSRPIAANAIAKIKRESQGTLIKFGGWR